MDAELILTKGRFTTLDPRNPEASTVAVQGGRFMAVGLEREVMRFKGGATRVIDLKGSRVIPGLNDSHIHVIREGLNYNMELRWDGVPSLADALRMLRDQAQRTPAPQWVRVIGGWSEFQFAERRMPTLAEINEAAPETPVFILHLYDRAFLNGAALRALGYSRDTPEFPGGEIQRDRKGNPTGLLIARPNATILYASLARGPKLSHEDQLSSSRLFMRELNRLGVTSVIDAGGGFQNYPDDYKVIETLARQGELTVLSALSEDYFAVPEERIKQIESLLTLMGGKVVYGAGEFATLAPPPLPVSPDWSPVKTYRGYHRNGRIYERAA